MRQKSQQNPLRRSSSQRLLHLASWQAVLASAGLHYIRTILDFGEEISLLWEAQFRDSPQSSIKIWPVIKRCLIWVKLTYLKYRTQQGRIHFVWAICFYLNALVARSRPRPWVSDAIVAFDMR